MNLAYETVDSDDFAGRSLVAIPCKIIKVESTNYGYSTEVEITE